MSGHRGAATPSSANSRLGDVLASRAKRSGDCVVDRNETLSARDLDVRARAAAAGLASLGIDRGDRVAIWLPNRAAWLVAFFACARLGAIAISINTRFRHVEVGDLLARSEAKVLIYWPGFKDIDFENILANCAAGNLAKLATIIAYTEGTAPPTRVADKPVRSWQTLLASPPLAADRSTPESLCAVFTTSGTTKAPKLVAHCQRNVLSHVRNVARQYGITSEHCVLLVPPFCGVYGFDTALTALVAGARLVIAPTWNPGEFADLIDAHRVTHFAASNEAIAQLLDARADRSPFPSLEFIVSANLNPTHADIAVRAAARGVKVVGLYGSSEVQALFSLSDRNAPPEIAGRAGGAPASALAKVRTRDPASAQICATGVAGELEILAPESRFVEYLNDPEATRAAFTGDGYFRTGDLAAIEPDGSFTYFGRIGDTLRLGGFLVAPAEIEEVLQEHPTVEACQIVGVTLGEALRPVAFVTARAGATIDEAALIEFAAARVAKYKVPARVYAVDEFPTTPSANGTKIQKGKLREMAEARLATTGVAALGSGLRG